MFQSVSKCFPLFPIGSVWSMFSQNMVCEFELSFQCSLLAIQRVRCRNHILTDSRVFIIYFIVRTSKPYIDVDHTYHVWIRPLNYMFMLIFVNIFVNLFSSECWIYSLFLYIYIFFVRICIFCNNTSQISKAHLLLYYLSLNDYTLI